MKNFLAICVLVLVTFACSSAEPARDIPWAQPQTFPEQSNDDVPLFERAMKEERRRKEQGLTDTVDMDSIRSTPQPKVEPSIEPKSDPVAQPQEEAYKVLEQGAKGAAVESVQKALLALGFALPAGADGDFGGQTVAAVKAFQSSRKLPLTGKLDEETYAALQALQLKDGKKLWEDPLVASQAVPKVPVVKEKKVRVLIDLSEHRLAVYDPKGTVQRVFPVASGAKDTPTDVGIKVVCEKLADPTKLAEKLWPESKGQAFGKRLIDLNWYNIDTGSQTISDEELHGTYVLSSIGSNASHGCVRLTNESIEWLYQNLTVGDLVLIQE